MRPCGCCSPANPSPTRSAEAQAKEQPSNLYVCLGALAMLPCYELGILYDAKKLQEPPLFASSDGLVLSSPIPQPLLPAL